MSLKGYIDNIERYKAGSLRDGAVLTKAWCLLIAQFRVHGKTEAELDVDRWFSAFLP